MVYVPETCRAKNTPIKLPCCIKLAFHFISGGRYTVKKNLKIPEYELQKCNPCTAKSWLMFLRKFICVKYRYHFIV